MNTKKDKNISFTIFMITLFATPGALLYSCEGIQGVRTTLAAYTCLFTLIGILLLGMYWLWKMRNKL